MVAWFCKIDGIEHGPLTQEKLVRMARQGRIGPDDLVRNELKDKWYKASSVDGLINTDDEAGGSSGRAREGDDASGSETSAEAQRLLKAFGKAKKEGSSEEIPAAREREEPASRSAQRVAFLSAPSEKEKKPFSRPQQLLLWITGGIAMLLILFPPFEIPNGLGDRGIQYGFLFTPPKFTAKVPLKGVKGKLSSNVVVVGQTAKGYKAVSWLWLLLELGGVLIAAGVVFLIMRTHEEVGPAPAKPQKKKPQTV